MHSLLLHANYNKIIKWIILMHGGTWILQLQSEQDYVGNYLASYVCMLMLWQ